MLLRTLYDDKLAQASYLIGCQATGQALVIDPNRDIDYYLQAARKEGLRITHVTETHIHADFVSGARELTQKTGARLYLSGEGGADWQYGYADPEFAVVVSDGDTFNVGNLRVQVMHTPGHTPEHICFLLTDMPVTDQAMGIFSGDFVFVGDVGRPDLLEKAAGVSGTMREGARELYQSLQRFRKLPDYMQVWPGHGAGSACGKALGAVPQSTVGYEKSFSTPFSFDNEAEFIDYILAGQPEPPKYFAQMKKLNREGPPILDGIRVAERLPDDALARVRARATLVDTRGSVAFGRGHLPGSINVPFSRSFVTYAGWTLSYDKPVAFISDEKNIAEIARDLAMIGFDNIEGFFTPDIVAQNEQQTIEGVPTSALNELLEREDVQVVDVRGSSEWQEGHIPRVPNIPYGYVADRADELPRDKKIVLHCEGGSRSAIAASVLQSLGYNVMNVRGGFSEWARSGGAVSV